MKKRLFMLMGALLLSYNVFAQSKASVSSLSFSDIQTEGTDKFISVSIEDKEDLCGIQLLFTPSVGITLEGYELGEVTSTKTGRQFDYSLDQSNISRAIISSSPVKPMADGEILKVYFSTSATFNGGTILVSDLHGGDAATQDYTLTDYTIVILGNGGYSTFGSADAWEVQGTAATAYAGIVYASDNVITLKSFEKNIIPANQGAAIKGTASSVVTLRKTDAGTFSGTNDFVAVTEAKSLSSDYVLATKSGDTVFGKYSGNIPAGKAYIPGTKVPSGAPLRIVTDATAIDAIESVTVVESYDLFGNKASGKSGQFMIENGKKVIRR